MVGSLLALLNLASPVPSVDAAQIFRKAQGAVVYIETEEAQGTGFSINNGRIIVTSHHVIEGTTDAVINRQIRAKVVASSKAADLAFLLPERPLTSSLSLAKTTPATGSRVYVIGHPLGLPKTISEGIVSSLYNRGVRHVQHTAPTSEGSSGGPVLNESGGVIGIVRMTLVEGQSLNFAVASTEVPKVRHAPFLLAMSAQEYRKGVAVMFKGGGTKPEALPKDPKATKPGKPSKPSTPTPKASEALENSLRIILQWPRKGVDAASYKAAEKMVVSHRPSLFPKIVQALKTGNSQNYAICGEFGTEGIAFLFGQVGEVNDVYLWVAIDGLADMAQRQPDKYPEFRTRGALERLTFLLEKGVEETTAIDLARKANIRQLKPLIRSRLAGLKDFDKWHAYRTLAAWAETQADVDEIQGAIDSLDELHSEEVEIALRWLQDSRHPGIAKLIVPFITYPDKRVQATAIRTLGFFKLADTYDLMEDHLDDDPAIAAEAYGACAQIDPKRILPALLKLSESTSADSQIAAIKGLGFIRSQSSIITILRLARNEGAGDKVGLAAVEALGTMGASALTALEELAKSSKLRVRHEAENVLWPSFRRMWAYPIG